MIFQSTKHETRWQQTSRIQFDFSFYHLIHSPKIQCTILLSLIVFPNWKTHKKKRKDCRESNAWLLAFDSNAQSVINCIFASDCIESNLDSVSKHLTVIHDNNRNRKATFLQWFKSYLTISCAWSSWSLNFLNSHHET